MEGCDMTDQTAQERAEVAIQCVFNIYPSGIQHGCASHRRLISVTAELEDAAYKRGRVEGLKDAMKVLATRTGQQGIIAELTRLAEAE